jgi:hypothetical protein
VLRDRKRERQSTGLPEQPSPHESAAANSGSLVIREPRVGSEARPHLASTAGSTHRFTLQRQAQPSQRKPTVSRATQNCADQLRRAADAKWTAVRIRQPNPHSKIRANRRCVRSIPTDGNLNLSTSAGAQLQVTGNRVSLGAFRGKRATAATHSSSCPRLIHRRFDHMRIRRQLLKSSSLCAAHRRTNRRVSRRRGRSLRSQLRASGSAASR